MCREEVCRDFNVVMTTRNEDSMPPGEQRCQPWLMVVLWTFPCDQWPPTLLLSIRVMATLTVFPCTGLSVRFGDHTVLGKFMCVSFSH